MSSHYTYYSPRECVNATKTGNNIALQSNQGFWRILGWSPHVALLLDHPRTKLHRVILASLNKRLSSVLHTLYGVKSPPLALQLVSRDLNQDYSGAVPWFGQQISKYSDLDEARGYLPRASY